MQASHSVGTSGDPTEEGESGAAEGRLARLRAALAGRLGRLRTSMAGALARRRARSPEADAQDNHPRDDAVPAAKPAARRARALAGYAAAILVGALLAGGGTYFLLAGRLDRQAAEAGKQHEEAARQKALVAGYETILSRESRQVEAERARLAEQDRALDAERKKLAEDQAKLEGEKQRLAALAKERPTSAAHPPATPSTSSTLASPAAATPAAGNCDVRAGRVAANLKACIDEFNRAAR